MSFDGLVVSQNTVAGYYIFLLFNIYLLFLYLAYLLSVMENSFLEFQNSILKDNILTSKKTI